MPPATRHGFDVARMMSYEVHGLRVSSSAVRAALAAGDMERAGRPARPALQHQRPRRCTARKLGRALGESSPGRGDGFRTLNLRFGTRKPAAMGIFVVRVHGLGDGPLDGVASLGRRPTVDDSGRVLLEAHCFDWPAGARRRGGLR